MTKERAFDLNERMIDYAVRIIKLSESLPETKVGKYVSLQILTAILFASIETAKKRKGR